MSNPEDRDQLTADELDSWSVPEPPDGFADRMLAARDAADASEPQAPEVDDDPREGVFAAVSRGRGLKIAAATMAAAACGALAFGWIRGRTGVAQSGVVEASDRVSIDLGLRGVAVAEPDSRLEWSVTASGSALVEQERGSVFYRVDRGGAFSVQTPNGTVRVTGTCFRVEIKPMTPSKNALIGAAIGAAIVVTVYEGSVLFANDKGESKVVAGEQLAVANGQAPGVAGAQSAGDIAASAADLPAAPSSDVTRDQLLDRDEVQRAEIAMLRRRLREAEQAPGKRIKIGMDQPSEDGRPWFDPSKESLMQMAKDCRVRYDLPPVMRNEPMKVPPKMADQLGLSGDEQTAVNSVLAKLHGEYVERLRALYIEATGDSAGVDSLSPEAMASELRDKSKDGEGSRIQQRISQERAGLIPPPQSLAGLSPLERYYRLLGSLGDETEASMAEVLSPARARELREANNGWGMRMEHAGCPDDEEQMIKKAIEEED